MVFCIVKEVCVEGRLIISVLTFGFWFGFPMFAFVNSFGIVGILVGIFVSSCILTVSFAWVNRQYVKKIYGHFRFAAWVKIQATLIAAIFSVMWLVTFLLIVSNPLLLPKLDPKSSASTNSATPAVRLIFEGAKIQ